jgi:hypothetical protein
MDDQRGEIVIGVMAVMCVVMMSFGGMSMMGGHWHGEEHPQKVQKQDHHDEGMHHIHNGVGEQTANPTQEEGK